MIRIGVIGTGVMGSNHIRVLSELPNTKLVGISDVNYKLASSIADKYHTKAFGNYKELLKQDLDAVTIAVPTSLHTDVALDVAEAGIHMLIEKPIADTVEHAEKIIETCNNHNIKLMVGHIERFNPIIPVIKNSITNDEVISINIIRIGPSNNRIKDVGVILDLATHDIDLIRFLTNSEFKKTFSLSSKNFNANEDCALLLFELDNGIQASINTNWLTPFKVREINIYTKSKYISGSFIDQKVIEYSKLDTGYRVNELYVPYGEPLKLELEAFTRCIKNNEKSPISGKEALEALKIVKMCQNQSNDSI